MVPPAPGYTTITRAEIESLRGAFNTGWLMALTLPDHTDTARDVGFNEFVREVDRKMTEILAKHALDV